MEWNIDTLVEKVRIAIDEITKDGLMDDFTVDADKEIRQALQHAINFLLGEVPLDYLTPVSLSQVVGDLDSVQEKKVDGSGSVLLPDDFLRLASFKLRSWRLPVFDLMDPTSDEAKRQQSAWGCGDCHKPRMMIVPDAAGHLRLMYWRAGRRSVAVTKEGETPSPTSPTYYDHAIDHLLYVPGISFGENDSEVDCPLKNSCEPAVIYRAAGIFLEGKKEDGLASRMYALSTSVINKTE